ncbi:uncharacterized protein DNG_04241 [Cephalotrichum gorgonifer]|uniref:Uncharacterized protein n=1 Tax=Cephalotrichum gorgonifer TaxID=2041049 RepID=A0AAE8MXQ4_9PEZI|nr:uncharacterized protein DNG_04241 [Cephalotrichum gorgonifer]
MLQDRESCDKSLPWVKVGFKGLESILRNHAASTGRTPPQITAVERMIQGAIRAFQLDVPLGESTLRAGDDAEVGQVWASGPTNLNPLAQTASVRGGGGPSTAESRLPSTDNPGNADMDWNIDFSAMDMEAFLSIDMTQEFNFSL